MVKTNKQNKKKPNLENPRTQDGGNHWSLSQIYHVQHMVKEIKFHLSERHCSSAERYEHSFIIFDKRKQYKV